LLQTREQLLGRVVRRALVTPVSLALVTASSLCLFEPSTWSLSGLGFVVEALVLQLLIRDPNFVRSVRDDDQQVEQRQRAGRLAEVRRSVDAQTGEMLGRIQAHHERLWRMEAAHEALSPGRLGIRLGETGALLDRCVHLAEKRHQLRLYMDSARLPDLQRQARQLEAKHETATDPVARQLYHDALEQKRGELESYGAIQQAVQRIDGQLESIDCSFGNLVGRLIRLNATDDNRAAVAQQQLSREITELNAHLDALDSSVNEMLAVERRA
jgi:hypothetical protein